MLNGVILLYGLLFHNFGLTIIVFTVAVRLVILPLTLRQLHASRSLSRIQPEMSKIQKKHAGDRQRMCDVGLTGFAELTLMRRLTEVVGGLQLRQIFRLQVSRPLLEQRRGGKRCGGDGTG